MANFGKAELIGGGDYPKGSYALSDAGFSMAGHGGWWRDVSNIVVVTEENRFAVGKTIGTAAVGALLLGPVGLLAGVFGRKSEVAFVAQHDTNGPLLFKSDARTFQKVMGAVLNLH